MPRPALALLLAAACSRQFDVPPKQPRATLPLVESIAPAHGFAGDVIRLSGQNLGALPQDVEVRLGASAPLRPSVAAAGTTLDVVVPDDATSGPVTVTTSGGRFSGAAFRFDGAGHLRQRRVATSVVLRPQFEIGFPVAGGQVALERDLYGRLVARSARTRPLPYDGVVAIARAGAERWAILQLSDAGSACGRLLVRAATLGEDTDPLVAPLGPAPCGPPRFLDASSDGALLAVIADRQAWFVDVRSGTPVVQRFESDGTFPWASVAWATGERFVIAEGGSVRLLDASGVGPAIGLVDGYISDVASDGASTIAVIGRDSGELVLAANWPPEVLGRAAASQRLSSGPRLAFSADGRRLGVSRPIEDVVETYDVQAPDFALLASERVPGARSLVAATNGWYVGAQGGLAVVDSASGALRERVNIGAAPRFPRLRTKADGATELLVAATAFDTLWRLDPRTLEPSESFRVALPHGARPFDMDVSTTASHIFLARMDDTGGGSMALLGGDEATPTRSLQLPPSYAGMVWWVAMTPDGSLGFLDWYDYTREYLVVLDPSDAWTEGRGQRTFVLPSTTWGVEANAQGQLAIAGDTFVRVLDIGAAREGQWRELADPTIPVSIWEDPAVVRTFSLAQDKFFVTNAGGRQLQVVDLTRGTASPPARLPLGYRRAASGLVASPSARWLWYIARNVDDAQLVSLPVDPATGALGTPEPPVVLPQGASSFYAYPDGERLVVVDAEQDRVLLLE